MASYPVTGTGNEILTCRRMQSQYSNEQTTNFVITAAQPLQQGLNIPTRVVDLSTIV